MSGVLHHICSLAEKLEIRNTVSGFEKELLLKDAVSESLWFLSKEDLQKKAGPTAFTDYYHTTLNAKQFRLLHSVWNCLFLMRLVPPALRTY